MGQVVGIDAPDAGDMGAVFGVLDVAHARQLVALLAVLTAALAVRLAGDGAVATAFAADAARSEDHVDRPKHILHAVAAVLDAARVHEEACLGLAPPLSGLANGVLGDARYLGGARRRPVLDV